MTNYYDVLEVHQEVSTEEIKRSFRMLIKKYHPDIHGPNKLWAESKTKVIIQAYKILSNSTTREQYDRLNNYHLQTHRAPRPQKGGDVSPENNAIRTKAHALLTDLLNGRLRDAIEKYERLQKEFETTEFLLHLKHRDYIDCKFLLAEAYEKFGKHEAALKLYEFLLERGKETTHRRHLAAEIKERIRNIYCRKLARNAPPEKALGYYEKALKLKLFKSENAFLYKKMAECYFELKEYGNAIANLNVALDLKPNLQGIQKLKAKLKQHAPNITVTL